MTTISAKIIADSISPARARLTTLQLRYPRFIHAEFMTHRVFSRNASSSRAVPVSKLIADVESDPAVPLVWGANKPGMQAGEELDELVRHASRWSPPHVAWKDAAWDACELARDFAAAGYHKQIVNRLLEPFAHINVVCTATEWGNFFALRDHPDAEPHIRMLAQAIKHAMDESVPVRADYGNWHMPYVSAAEIETIASEIAPGGIENKWEVSVVRRWVRLVSAARCARVSYRTHDGEATRLHDDLALAERLLSDRHMSPFEHQATPDFQQSADSKKLGANFRGWLQHRKLIEAGLYEPGQAVA